MYRICLTYTLHVHHVHELCREYLHCSSETNLMLDLFSRGKLIIADFREASQSQNKSFFEFKKTATFKKLK